MKIIR
jgi:hypothetical protein